MSRNPAGLDCPQSNQFGFSDVAASFSVRTKSQLANASTQTLLDFLVFIIPHEFDAVLFDSYSNG